MIQKIKNLLFENTSIKQTIAKNTFWVGLAQAFAVLGKTGFIIYVARFLGATEYGRFNFALAYTGLFAILTDLGLSSILSREFAQNEKAHDNFSQFFTLKLILSGGAFLLCLLGSLFLGVDYYLLRVIWLFSAYTCLYGFIGIFYAYFGGTQHLQYLAISDICISVISAALGIWAVMTHSTSLSLALAYLAAILVSFIWIFYVYSKKNGCPKLVFDFSLWKSTLIISIPLAFVALFSTVYNNIDQFILGMFGQFEQVGWYGAALKIISVSLIPMAVICGAFLPMLNKLYTQDKEKFSRVFNFEMEIMIMLATAIFVGGSILAYPLIGWAFDQTFFPAAQALRILLLTSVVFYFYQPIAGALISANKQKWLLISGLTAALLNTVLDILLVPKFSLYGTAIASVIGMTSSLLVIVLVMQSTKIANLFSRENVAALLLSLFCAAGMALVLLPIRNSLHVIILTFLGMVIYLGLYCALRFTLLKRYFIEIF